ncbi:MAG: hypothetical protein L7U87_00070 [Chlamydiales bacterium]|nr:hypothetical protein [Chlamydiales bacterium]
MTYLDKAKVADRDGDVISAAKSYLNALESKEPYFSDDYINALVLFFFIEDYGVISSLEIPEDMSKNNVDIIIKLLQEAKEKFPDNNEIIFWEKYIKFIIMGDSFPLKEAQELSEFSLVPTFYLYSASEDKSIYLEKAKELQSFVSSRVSTKERYIYSVLEGL